jgi:hypothetical protein
VTAFQDWLTVSPVDLKTVESLKARVCDLLRGKTGVGDQEPRLIRRGIERC